ncbi:MAG: cytochrome oxidase subunit III, partial [Actinobacteria bacterium]|nr:cytochrome oxidase subunit III [Actinomycetota bacterium]
MTTLEAAAPAPPAPPHEKVGHGHAAHATSTGISNEKVAMWAFLGSECLLFGALISTYLLYKGRSLSGPLPEDVFDIPFTSVSSFVLLMSSVTMVLALSAIQRGDGKRLRIWLTTTALLGA